MNHSFSRLVSGLVFTTIVLACLLCSPNTTSAAELLTNGSFETGTFTGWTAVNATSSWMDWQVSSAGAGGGFDPPYPTQPQDGTRSAWNGVTANANQVYILYQNVTVPSGANSSLTWKDRFQMNLLDFCSSAPACGEAFYVVDIMDSTGTTVLQTLYSVTAPPLTETDTGWQTHSLIFGTAYAGQTVRLRFRSWGTVTFAGPGQAEIDAVSFQADGVVINNGQQNFVATLDAPQEVPPTVSTASGGGSVILNSAETQAVVTLNFSGLSSAQTAAHIHKGARGVSGPVEIGLPNGNFTQTIAVTPAQVADLKAGLWYFNVHSADFPGGEIRGQIEPLCAPAPADPAVWLKGEGNAQDSSGVGNHGTFQGALTYGTGKVGQAFSYNGSDSAVRINQVANNLNYGTSNFTIGTWVKYTSTSKPIYANGYNLLPSVSLSIDSVGVVVFVVRDNSGNLLIQNTLNPLNDGLWHYVAGVRQGTTISLYVDGILQGSQTKPSLGSISASCGFDWVGGGNSTSACASPANGPFFNGMIDELQIYKRALSPSEIKAIINSGSAGVCALSKPTAWFRAESNALDSSGNGAHGTVFGSLNYAPGRVGQAFGLNGTNATVRINEVANNLNVGPWNFTVGTWVKFSATGTATNLYANGYNNLPVVGLGVSANSRAELFLRDNSGNVAWATGTTALNDNAWHYVVGVRDGTTANVYVDGVMQTSVNNPSLGPINAACGFDWISGANSISQCASTPFNGHFAGLIDEMQVYRHALSGSEIRAQYSAGSRGTAYGRTNTQTIPRNGRLAFHRDESIYTANPDGSNELDVSNGNFDIHPDWSPDGKMMVFASSNGLTYEIYKMNANGSNRVQLTANSANDSHPSWSPDGSKIVFSSDRDGNDEVYVMNADGSSPTRLTNSAGIDIEPEFSPDGSRIAFSRLDAYNQIWVMNANGSGQVNISNVAAYEYDPSWSPDGTRIAFASGRSGNFEIWSMNPNGTSPQNLTNNAAYEDYPSWSPDGSKLSFISHRDSNYNVYVMDLNGAGQTRVTNTPSNEFYTTWQPVHDVDPMSDINVSFQTLTQSGHTVATPLTPQQIPALPVGYRLFAGAPIYDIRTSALYSGTVTVTQRVFGVPYSQSCGNLRLLHFENGAWTTSGNGMPSYEAATQTCTVSQTVSSLSPFAVADLPPTAASVSVGGRIMTSGGTGIKNAVVQLTLASGETRTARTSSFGYYRFDEVESGQTAIVSIASKRFVFVPRSVALVDSISDLDFIAPE